MKVRSSSLGPVQSEAARRLWKVLPRFGGQNGLSRALGDSLGECSSGLVNRWLHCIVKPGTRWASRIQDVTGIAVDTWMMQPKSPIVFVVVHN